MYWRDSGVSFSEDDPTRSLLGDSKLEKRYYLSTGEDMEELTVVGSSTEESVESQAGKVSVIVAFAIVFTASNHEGTK